MNNFKLSFTFFSADNNKIKLQTNKNSPKSQIKIQKLIDYRNYNYCYFILFNKLHFLGNNLIVLYL
jgi:hypothetical protein